MVIDTRLEMDAFNSLNVHFLNNTTSNFGEQHPMNEEKNKQPAIQKKNCSMKLRHFKNQKHNIHTSLICDIINEIPYQKTI